DEHRGTLITHSQADAAKIDGKKKNGCIRHALCKPRRSREAADAAAASKSKNRQALDGRRKSQPVYQAGIEARHRQSGDRVGDDHVDASHLDSCIGYRLQGHLFEEIERVTLEGFRPLLPSVWLQAPFERLAEVASLDSCMGIDVPHGFELRAHHLRELGYLVLVDPKLRICRCNGQNLDVEAHARLPSKLF